MSTKNKEVATVSVTDVAIYNALKDAGKPLTFAELKGAVDGVEIFSGNLTSAKKRGFIAEAGEAEIVSPSTKEVTVYKFVDKAVHQNAKGEDYTYKPEENAILDASENVGEFITAELEAAMGIKIPSARLTNLVKKGNLAKVGTREVPSTKKSTVKVWTIGDKVPGEVGSPLAD